MENLLKKLKENNMNGYLAENSKEALALAVDLIPAGARIAMGNSLTLRQTGIFAELVSGKYNLINQFAEGIAPEENLKRRREGLLADVYFSSANAITLNGELINVDGKGNRVAAMLFGPPKIIVIAGINKVVRTEEEAWERIRSFTAPGLAKQLGRKTPCSLTGQCSDCNSPQRICRCYTVIKSQMPADKDRIHVIIVNENLGI
ncbi:MAG: lactate utilization protein [Peptococcaceae bacterium]